jgi:hypothetical protein
MHALSLPTWLIHISSVLEWIAAIGLISAYAQVSGRTAWYALSYGMLPSLVSAMCACTWHFYDNSPSLQWLVVTQAATTLLGNCTLCIGAWWIWHSAKNVAEK